MVEPTLQYPTVLRSPFMHLLCGVLDEVASLFARGL